MIIIISILNIITNFRRMKIQYLILTLFFALSINLLAQEKQNILVTGYWNPTGKMIAHFSNDTILNADGWQGENWEGLGFNVHSFFPEPGVYTGIFEVDYQNVLRDFNHLTDSLKPVAVISFGAGNGPWEIESGARNLNSWVSDGNLPYYPTPNPPDSTTAVNTVRSSTLPLEEIYNSVNNETTITARIDTTNNLGAYICEFTGFLDAWYHDNNQDESSFPCYKSGFIHVKSNLPLSSVTKAANITVRETANALLREYDNVYGNVYFSDTSLTAIGTQINFNGEENYTTTINNEDGRYTIPFIKPGNYQLVANFNNEYLFDSINVVINSTQQIDIVLGANKIPSLNEQALFQNYPNPFTDNTKIGFVIEENSHVSLKVYDISGKHVKTIADKEFESGYHYINWNGENTNGKKLSPGVYIFQFHNNGTNYYKQGILIK